MNRIVLLFLFCEILVLSAAGQNGEGTVIMPRPADFPTPPASEKSLFFIQRNRNKNTVIYDANLKSDGNFSNSRPIDVYWIKYNSTGNRAELTWLQRTFAFGYNSKKDGTGRGYWITLTAYDGRKIHLEKTTAGKPVATMTINGKYCRLRNIWVYADESGTWPKVLHVDLFGTDMATGKEEFERIFNK
jgi:hypothetical protein